MRTVKAPDVRKREILDTAVHVFAQKGYDSVSIADIAREAGISQGLCYRYFSTKEALYDEAVEVYADSIVSRCLSQREKLSEQIAQRCGELRQGDPQMLATLLVFGSSAFS